MADVEIPDWLRSLPLAPEYRPTDTEFADPIAFISRIEQEASAFGICKVVPPLPKPSKRFVLSNLNRSLSDSPDASGSVFTTRCQELGSRRGCPSVHKQVWQSGKFYSLEQFEAKSRAFARTHLGNCKDTHPMEVETLFWKAAAEKPIYVEYANDVPGSGFHPPADGYPHRRKTRHGRPRKEAASENDGRVDGVSKYFEGTAGWKLSNSPWNLQVIARSPGSLTRFMPDEVPGVTSPMVYIGMLFSWFAWHVEDHELHSLNFLHTGASKSWYAVPGSYASVLEEVVRIEGYGSHVDHLAAFIMLGEKRTLISPEVLIASGIPCCRLVQNPGEFVVTFPRAYHVGFSHGFNCGEAANFATYKWLNVAKEAAVRRASMSYLPMLSHQQLLYLLAMSFISRVPRELLPGARSSRLRDRIKEERELVVKKSFLEDIMIEHKLLKVLLGKKSTLNVVLWDTDMLPQTLSYSESSPSLSFEQLALDAVDHETESQLVNKQKPLCFDTNNCSVDESHGDENRLHDTANKVCSNNKQNSEYSDDLKGSCSGFLNGSMRSLYDDDSDLPCGLDVDPGALVCVGCGILGYPFMSVIQPSDNAFEALLNTDSKAAGQKPEKLKLPLSSSSKSPMGEIDSGCMDRITENNLNRTNTLDVEDWTDADTDVITSVPIHSRHDSPHKWDLSDQRFRPYIFCLQHAIEVEKKLQCFGGARLLIICHSDYPKIKSQAMSLKDISTLLHCEDISVEKASKEDLDLINISIDNERCENIEEYDWTSKMGLNLKHFIKCRKENSDKQESFCLSLDGLFPCLTPQCGLTPRWPARRSRTPYRFMATSRYRFQPGPFSNNNVTMTNPPCNALGDALVAKSCEERSMPARSIDLGFSVNQLPESHKGNGLAGDGLVTGDGDRNLSGCVAHKKHQIDIIPHIPMTKDKKHGSNIDIPTLEGKASCKPELPVQTEPYETFSLLETKAERLYGLQPVTESTIEASNQRINIEFRRCLVDSQNNNPSGEVQPSLFSSGSCEVQQGLLDASSADGKSENDIIAGSCNSGLEGKSRNATITRCGNSVLMEDGNENIEAEMKHRNMFNLEETPSKGILTEGGIYGKTSLNDLQTAVGSSCKNLAMPQMICSTDIFRKVGMDLFPMRSKAVTCYHRKRKKSDNVVSSTLHSAGNDTASTYNDDGNLKVQETPPCIKQRAKRKRELEYLSCIQYNFGKFTRSPCEGLRVRSGRSFEVTKNKGTTSLGPKMNSVSHLVSRRKGSHGQNVCTLGCCYMRFDTKKELALHKQNCCTDNHK